MAERETRESVTENSSIVVAAPVLDDQQCSIRQNAGTISPSPRGKDRSEGEPPVQNVFYRAPGGLSVPATPEPRHYDSADANCRNLVSGSQLNFTASPRHVN